MGETFECADGCNSCECFADGNSQSVTDMDCLVECTDATGTYAAGESWTCEDGCNTCACLADGTITSTEMVCM